MENCKLTETYQLVNERKVLSDGQKKLLVTQGELKMVACYWSWTENVEEDFFLNILTRDSWRLLKDCLIIWCEHENLCELLIEKGSKFLVACFLMSSERRGLSAHLEKALIRRKDLDLLSIYEEKFCFEDESVDYLAELAKSDPGLDKWRQGLDI